LLEYQPAEVRATVRDTVDQYEMMLKVQMMLAKEFVEIEADLGSWLMRQSVMMRVTMSMRRLRMLIQSSYSYLILSRLSSLLSSVAVFVATNKSRHRQSRMMRDQRDRMSAAKKMRRAIETETTGLRMRQAVVRQC